MMEINQIKISSPIVDVNNNYIFNIDPIFSDGSSFSSKNFTDLQELSDHVNNFFGALMSVNKDILLAQFSDTDELKGLAKFTFATAFDGSAAVLSIGLDTKDFINKGLTGTEAFSVASGKFLLSTGATSAIQKTTTWLLRNSKYIKAAKTLSSLTLPGLAFNVATSLAVSYILDPYLESASLKTVGLVSEKASGKAWKTITDSSDKTIYISKDPYGSSGNYSFGGSISFLNLETENYFLGYIAEENRLEAIDKNNYFSNIIVNESLVIDDPSILSTLPKTPNSKKQKITVVSYDDEGKETKLYTIQDGDTLWVIGQQFGLTKDQILQANTFLENRINGDFVTIYAGEKIVIPGTDYYYEPLEVENQQRQENYLDEIFRQVDLAVIDYLNIVASVLYEETESGKKIEEIIEIQEDKDNVGNNDSTNSKYDESLYRPVTTAGIIGAAVGGQIGGYFADNTFAGQLLARSAGSTLGGWIGDAIDYEIMGRESLSGFALPNRFSTTLISNAISLGASQLSEYLFDIWDLDDPLEQLITSTVVSSVASYSAVVAAESVATSLLGNSLAGSQIAVKYFGADPITYSIHNVEDPVVLGTDLSLSTFGSQVLGSLTNALGGYAGQQVSNNLFDLSFETQVGGQLGSTLGGIVGSTLIPIPFLGGAIGSAIGNIYGSFVGYLTEEIPVLGYALGGWVIELIEVFADKDYPRAAYVVQVENGQFISKFAYQEDDGNIQVAQHMADVAQNLLDFWASNIGGILLRSDEIFYGHWANEDGNQMVYQLADDAPGGSSFRRRVGFGDDGKAAVEAGVVVQLTTTEIEGGDRYIKRFLSVFNDPRSNLDALNRNFQIAKEYGIYRDNPALYLELINDLKTNAITRADAAILDLQNHPWDAYTPPERNPVIVKDIAEGILPNAVTLSIEGDNLLINNGTFTETLYQWTKTQGEHKVQKLRFSDGSLYQIIANVQSESANQPQPQYAVGLQYIQPDLTIKDFDLAVLPSQVILKLEGNDLIVNNERFTSWLTTTGDRLEVLRFGDGSRFKIVAEDSTVKLEHELVANWKEVSEKSNQFSLDTPQDSDLYKGENSTLIVYGSNGLAQGEADSGDILISSADNETLRGNLGDDVYLYSRGDGLDTIEDLGGLDVIQFDSTITIENITLASIGNDLVLKIDNNNQITFKNFVTNPIEIVRLGNNQEYLFSNNSGNWQLTPANSIKGDTNSNVTINGTIGADVLRGLGDNDTLAGGAGDDIYLYFLSDGLNTTIFDTGDYGGKVRDGGTDVLVLATDSIYDIKLVNEDLILTVDRVKTAEGSSVPLTITLKNWTDQNSRIEFFRFANGQDYYPVIDTQGNVSLQPVINPGQSTLDVELDVPDSYTLTSYRFAVVDLTGNGLQLISATQSTAMADLDNDGYLEQMGWVTASDALLVWDINNDGKITGTKEHISLSNNPETTFISSLDTNGDRLLSHLDANFEQLRLWLDNNGNHIVELGELIALHRFNLDEIALESQSRNFEIAGNQIKSSTYFSQLGFQYRKYSQIYDVSFSYNPNGVRFENLNNELAKFDFENKPDILVDNGTSSTVDFAIDPAINYSVTGTKGNDRLVVKTGATQGVVINGGEGNDTIIGGDGNDILTGGTGRDIIKGLGGDDVITIDQNDDFRQLDGGDGFDIIAIDQKSASHIILDDSHNIESIIGSKISDHISYGGFKNIIISGDKGNDWITGGYGNDQLEGGDGQDKTYGNKGNDILLGGTGDDQLYGEESDDLIYGQEGNDLLDGSDGNDILDGGLDDDLLRGGTGNNTYVFGIGDGWDTVEAYSNPDGIDTITFKAGISPDDIILWRDPLNVWSGNDLYLEIKKTGDRLIIKEQFSPYNNDGVEKFIFTNGIVWTKDYIKSRLLSSTSQDDLLWGYESNDILDGGLGNDSLWGGTGNNTYIFGTGYGVDTVTANSNPEGIDILSFNAGISPNDIILWRNSSNSDLYLAIKGTNDRLIVKNQFDSNYGIDQLVFMDGTLITRDDINNMALSDHYIQDNVIIGDENSNTLEDSLGNDILEGGTGPDTYVFKKGYGQDLIRESYYGLTQDYDIVQFGAGLTPLTMDIVREGNNLVFKVIGTSDRLTIQDQFEFPAELISIEEFRFGDGTVWSKEDIKQEIINRTSTSENDIIQGYSENGQGVIGDNSKETLDGGLGNDILMAGTGNDNYVFNYGYGRDIIQESEYIWDSNYDIVKFGVGLTPSSMKITRESNDLIFTVIGTTDSLRIKEQFNSYSESYSIEEFHFDNDSLIWTKSDIKNYLLVSDSTDNTIQGYSESGAPGIGDNSKELLDGGWGNDLLQGETGDDTYIFNYGYGQDIIQEGEYFWDSTYDSIKFGVGLNLQTMEIYHRGNTLVFQVIGTNDQLIINDQSLDYKPIEKFYFDDGAIALTVDELYQQNNLLNISRNAKIHAWQNSKNIIDGYSLATSDRREIPDKITYTVTSLPQNGELLLDNKVLALNDSFTQKDLENNLVSYEHNGTFSLFDNFRFDVGNDQGETASNQIFEIEIDNFGVTVPSDTDASTNTIAENATNGSTVGITASATDGDGTNNTVTYSLTDNAGGRFTIDSTTGVVTVVDGTLLNFEIAQSHNITVQATSSDTSTATQTFTIVVTDVNEATNTIVSITPLDANKAEGNSGTTPFTFTVSRSGDLSSAVSVDYTVEGAILTAVVDGSLSASTDDFAPGFPLTGTIAFDADEASKVFTVEVAGDTTPELEGDYPSQDVFIVSLSNPSGGASLDEAFATGSIVNDDEPTQRPITSATPEDDDLTPQTGSFSGVNSLVFTGAGNDRVDIPAGQANLGFSLGFNRIFTGSDIDEIFVADGDRAFGGSGNDILDASDASGYRLSGGAGDDQFFLGVGGRALGGDGNETFTVGEDGGNLLSGGAGSDLFNILTDNPALFTTPNTIVDFTVGTDTLGILNQGVNFGFNDLTLEENEIKVGSNTIAILVGVQTSTLTTNDFTFS